MYLITILIFIAALGLNLILTGTSFLYMFDLITLLLIPLTLIPVLIASGMEKDLLCAFRFAGKKPRSFSPRQLKRCEEALRLSMRFILYAGILTFLVQTVAILKEIIMAEENFLPYRMIAANFSTAALSMIYPLFLYCMLLPLRSKIRGALINIETSGSAAISEEALL